MKAMIRRDFIHSLCLLPLLLLPKKRSEFIIYVANSTGTIHHKRTDKYYIHIAYDNDYMYYHDEMVSPYLGKYIGVVKKLYVKESYCYSYNDFHTNKVTSCVVSLSTMCKIVKQKKLKLVLCLQHK